jgi:hypothetical protein
VGWVRGDVETWSEALAENGKLRKQIQALEEQLDVARTQAPPSAEGLAGGNDRADFDLRYKAQAEVELDEPDDDGHTSYYATFTGEFRPDATWDQYFSLLGPPMLDEADQRLLKRQVDRWVNERPSADTLRAMVESLDSHETLGRVIRVEVFFSDENFGTLIVQLRALGLIEKHTKARCFATPGRIGHSPRTATNT